MARKKLTSPAEVTDLEELALALSPDLAGAVPEGDNILSAISSAQVPTAKHQPEPPSMASAEWQDHVMSMFAEGELDPDGRPMVHGLRRVVRVALGPILQSTTRIVQAPSGEVPAVAEHTVVIKVMRPGNGIFESLDCVFSDAADAHAGNVPDRGFARFLTALAATRAESRALRKALQLRGASSEEMAPPLMDPSPDGAITEDQINFINALSRRNDVNVLAFVNSGKLRYNSIQDVSYETAQLMTERLSGLQQRPEQVRPEWKGYDANWRAAA